MLQGQGDFLQILKKYKKSKKYSELQEQHIQCINQTKQIQGIIDELKNTHKYENYDKFFETLKSSLSTISSFKFLILTHKLIYQIQQEFAIKFLSNRLIPGDMTEKSRMAIYYYTFQYKICENFQYFQNVIDYIETDNITNFLKYELQIQIQTLQFLAQILQELSNVVKILDYLLCRESPLLLQIGTCILKDFSVIYNFLSIVMQEQQSRSIFVINLVQILKVPLNEAKILYQVYQITIQMTKCMKRLQQLKLYSNLKQPQYFTITIELNKKIELYMLGAIKLSNIEISI